MGTITALVPSTIARSQVAGQLQTRIVLPEDTPLAHSDVLIDRLFRPLLAERLRAEMHAAGSSMQTQNVDPANEHFTRYVPHGSVPPGGYGVLVFIAPLNEPQIPPSWLPALDRHGIICVSAHDSGNAQNVFTRRIPLALLGLDNIKRQFSINPEQVFVAGLSGGSRVALHVAVAFPDVFHGAVLNAGSDVFGSAELPPPSPALFRELEQRTRLIYATGSLDEARLAVDAQSRASARALCVSDLHTLTMLGKGHVLLDAGTLDRALTELTAARSPTTDRAECRARRDTDINRRLDAAQALLDDGHRDEALHELQRIDENFGGLALPRSVELAHRANAGTK